MTPREALDTLYNSAFGCMDDYGLDASEVIRAKEVLERLVKEEEDEVLVDED